MPEFTFVPAAKTQGKARVALAGPSGSGKTYTALATARGLAGEDGRIAVIDTEHGSASKYADRFRFDVLCLDTFAPMVYVQAINAAEAAGYDVIVIDSLSLGVFLSRGLYLTAMLFAVYLVLIVIGYRRWRGQLLKSRQ